MRAHSDELLTFVTIVECGSFSQAAERLNQANSVVSRTFKRLEKKLGITLLNRTTRQISLTEEGESYFLRVQKILNELSVAESELLEGKHEPQGLLRVDAATPVMLHLITPYIAEFCQRYPKIRLVLDSTESIINLLEQKVDIAIRVGELPDSTLRARLITTSYRQIVAAPAYLRKMGIPQNVEELSQHTTIGFSDNVALNQWPLTKKDGSLYEITPKLYSNNGETIRRLCLESNGIGCLSRLELIEDIAKGELIPLFSDELIPLPLPIHAVYYSDQAVSARLRTFIDYLIEKIGPSA